MLRYLAFGLIVAVVADSVVGQDTECNKIEPATGIDILEGGRFYYCKSGDTSNLYCAVDIEKVPGQDKSVKNTIVYLQPDTKQVKSYNLDEQEKKGLFFYPGQKIYGAVAGVTDDKECFAFLKCPEDKSSVSYIFLCKKPEQCQGDKYDKWLGEQVAKTPGVVPASEMKNSYKTCKAKGVVDK